MPEILLLQPFEGNTPSRTISTTVPSDVPIPAFSLFQEVRTAPDTTAIVVGLEWISLHRSEFIYEDPSYEGWWVHIEWRFDSLAKTNSRIADTLGHTWPEERLEDAAERYQRSRHVAIEPVQLLSVAS